MSTTKISTSIIADFLFACIFCLFSHSLFLGLYYLSLCSSFLLSEFLLESFFFFLCLLDCRLLLSLSLLFSELSFALVLGNLLICLLLNVFHFFLGFIIKFFYFFLCAVTVLGYNFTLAISV